MTDKLRWMIARALALPSLTRALTIEESPFSLVELDRVAELAEDQQRFDAERGSMMTEINKFTLAKLSHDQVNVRAVRAANDVVDSYDSRFTLRGLQELARVARGAPMAMGHNMAGDVYARVFAGSVTEPPGGASKSKPNRNIRNATWMHERFYWPKDMPDAEGIRSRIDGGLWREVSVHFRADELPCGVCEKDVRECEHMPGTVYDGTKAWYDMQAVTRMLETSFVVRGAQLETQIGPDQGRGWVRFEDALGELKSDKQLADWWRRGCSRDGGLKGASAAFAISRR